MKPKELEAAIERQVKTLQKHGTKAQLSTSYNLLQLTTRQLSKYGSINNQCLWRKAAIAHMAMLCVDGLWPEALSISDDPLLVGRESNRYPWPTTPESKKLTVLMYTNMVVCHLLADRLSSNTDWLIEEGLRYLKELQNPRLNRWKAVLLIAKALRSDEEDRYRYATQASRFARHPVLVPELYAFIDGKTFNGDGTIKPSLFQRRRPAALRPEDCLYLFND